jgi:hypothetical protein
VGTSFVKGVVVGAIASAVTVISTAAFAGSGIGGVFDLGKNNPVNAKTELSGSTNDQQLRIVNSNTGSHATGLGISVAKDHAPLAVNSSTKVAKLNADFVDGVDSSQLQRTLKGTCDTGKAITRVNADGTISCTYTAIHPLVADIPEGEGEHEYINEFPGTSLSLYADCERGGPYIEFSNASNGSASLNWTYSPGGSTDIASGVGMAPGAGQAFNYSHGRLEGQWIYSDASAVITINLHTYDGSTFCEIRGTAEISYAP